MQPLIAFFVSKINLVFFFSFYSFVFYLPSMLLIGKGATILGLERTHWLVACNALCLALGYLSYPVSRKVFKSIKARKQVFLVLGVALLLYMLLMLQLQSVEPLLCLLILGGEAFLMGHLSGYVFFYLAMSLQGSHYLGRFIGFTFAVGVVLQNLTQHYMNQEFEAAIITLVLTIVGMMLMLWQAPKYLTFEDALPYEKQPPAWPRQGLLGVALVLVMTMMNGFFDSYLTYLNAHQVLDEAGWPRLFFAVGLIVAGFLSDLKQHRYLLLSTLCSSMLCLSAAALLAIGNLYNLALSMIYWFCGFFVVFLMVFFFTLAPCTNNPPLWVVMGRVVYSTGQGLLVLMAPQLRQLLTGESMLLVNTVLIVFLIVLVYQMQQPQKQPKEGEEKLETIPLNRMERFMVAYDFTPREMEVFELLLDDSLTVQDIADRLFISRRVCQRYLSSMYEKTGTKVRLNLLLKYYREDEEVCEVNGEEPVSAESVINFEKIDK